MNLTMVMVIKWAATAKIWASEASISTKRWMKDRLPLLLAHRLRIVFWCLFLL